MIYDFKCVNLKCKERNKIKEKEVPMKDAGCTQYCEVCKEPLQKIYSVQGHGTFSDGYKS